MEQVVINGQHSKSLKVTSGVPKEVYLAPIPHTYTFNDLPELINSIVKMFADYMV